jgi:hypothetical protein
MNVARRMSMKEAQMAADEIAAAFIQSANTRGFTPTLQSASPDPLSTEQIGKVPRSWVALVDWRSSDGGLIDGPSVLRVDLVTSVASWT